MIEETRRPCPVCGSRRAEVVHHQEFRAPSELFAEPAIDVVICTACGMCFSDLAVVQDSVDATYAEHSKYADTSIYEDGQAGSAADLPTGAPWDLDRLEGTARWLARHVPLDARVLDAGCATGALIGYLQREGFTDLVGLDPSPIATAQAARAYGVPAITGSFLRPPDDIGTFDLVVLSHVLEHLVDVQGAVAGLAQLVKPGGLAYIEVPDASRYYEYLVAPFHDFNTEHVNHFSGTLLTCLMSSAGFATRQTAAKTVLIAATTQYPAVFGLYERTAAKPAAGAAEKDPTLRVAIQAYIDASTALLDEVDASLRVTVGSGPVVVWGAGQLAMKLLVGSLADVEVAAIVDSARDKWGGRFGDVPVIGPQQLDDLVDQDVPILVTSIHHQDAIVATIESMFPRRRVLTLR
jgi:ubiquinone/menaquinone biosynthesis C-methylase UbiE